MIALGYGRIGPSGSSEVVGESLSELVLPVAAAAAVVAAFAGAAVVGGLAAAAAAAAVFAAGVFHH